ncbi:hypothetical protein QYM36_019186 [Artemia franciscana]|uniref:Uncharacterized protein n=1 Tax=Artemia franciscana TaxID=6661 RepID=A0AA88H5K9_ARTSF|nr:hypothetical protein QYM36_019186 [Artemia franciscana]
MKSVFADLDERSGSSFKGEEIKSSDGASKSSLQKVQNEYKPVGQLEENRNLGSKMEDIVFKSTSYVADKLDVKELVTNWKIIKSIDVTSLANFITILINVVKRW